MENWALVCDKYDPKQEGLREALCVLGNGYMATRGAGDESRADGIHYPGTYLAGGYNRLTSEIAGHTIENEDLVNFPNWLPLNFRIGEGPWFNLDDVRIRAFKQTLHIDEGVLARDIRFQTQDGLEATLSTRRFVSMHDPHAAGTEWLIRPENWDGDIEICSALDGRIQNTGVKRYQQLNNRHLESLETRFFDGDGLYLQVRTNQSHLHLATAARTRLFLDETPPDQMKTGDYVEEGYIANRIKLPIRQKQSLRIEKTVAVFTSRDRAVSECGLAARKFVTRAGRFGDLLERHRLAWKQLWRRFDIQVDIRNSEDNIPGILRLHLFHLLQTTSLHSLDLDAGVPPRGWHGEAYRGHILWDELFVFPTLNLQVPEITRALLLYRYRRLPEARLAARAEGVNGAMYPWQSGSTGREESQNLHLNPESGRWIPDHSRLQRHVNAAIAYNVWRHYEATGDVEFLSFYGAEMLLEIARFWASLASFNRETGRYDIRHVMGPDEFHDGYPDAEKPGLTNNTYTNVMAAWSLSRGLEVLDILPKDRKQELMETLSLGDDERREWDRIRRKLAVPFHSDGVISQFEGYETLDDLDWKKYRKKYGDIQRLDRILEAEGDSPNRYQMSKQADVLMLFYLFSAEELRELFVQLGYELDKETIPNTVKYYMDRTSHGSTLSRLVHSWVLSRSNRDASWDLFCTALKSDVADIQGGTTPEGIHLGAMAGTVDLLQRCYSGIEFRGNVLRFNPRLPKELEKMRTEIRYRGQSLSICITQETLRISSQRVTAEPIRIVYRDEDHTLKEGETLEINLSPLHTGSAQ